MAEPPSNDNTSDDESCAPTLTLRLQDFYNDDSKVPPGRRNAFILMLAPEAIPGFSVDTTQPYPQLQSTKGYKNLFKPSKEMICHEAKRRDPNIKMNAHNRSNQALVSDLSKKLGHFLTQDDKDFIVEKEAQIRLELSKGLSRQSDSISVRSVIGSDDQLRLAAAIGLEKNLLLFKSSQQTATRDELDSGTSPKQKLLQGLSDTFNDASYTAIIPSLPNLHDDFMEGQTIGKGEYVMTPTKVAELLQQRKLEMKDISDRFAQSGNGEDMLGENGEVIDGAKRSSFLRGKPSDLLYWWTVFEENDLMAMTFANFGTLSVDGTTETPAKRSATSASSSDTKKKFRSEINDNVLRLNMQMIQSTKSEYMSQLNDFKEKRFQIRREMRRHKKDEYSNKPSIGISEEKWETIDDHWCEYKARLKEIEKSIAATENMIEDCHYQLLD